MSQHPEVTTIGPDSGVPPIVGPIAASPVGTKPVAGGAKAAPEHGPQRIPRWLRYTLFLLWVEFCLLVGIGLTVAPWSPLLWDRNPLFEQFPVLASYAANGAVRGLITGLGLLNLWIALQDAIRHRDK